MIMDELGEFADSQSIAAVASTILSTNVVDLQSGRDVGMGQPIYLVIQIDTAVVGSSSTINFRLRSDSTAAIHATTSTAHIETGAIAEALLVIGYQTIIPLPMGTAYERYIGVQAIIGTATTSAGAYSAFLTLDPAGWTSYADAVN